MWRLSPTGQRAPLFWDRCVTERTVGTCATCAGGKPSASRGVGPPAGTASREAIRPRGGGPIEARGAESSMTPNQITAIRIVAAFAAVALFAFFGQVLAADLAAVALTVAAIALDGLDGYVARARGLATPLGAQLDILGDRIVENLFFTFFAVSGLVPIWVPILFFARGTLTDFARAAAARYGRIEFGREGTIETSWARGLVASRASRGSYAHFEMRLLLLARRPAFAGAHGVIATR